MYSQWFISMWDYILMNNRAANFYEVSVINLEFLQLNSITLQLKMYISRIFKEYFVYVNTL